VNLVDDQSRTPLHWAVLCDKGAAVKALIALRATLAAKDRSDREALHHAALFGSHQIVLRLLHARAPLNDRDLDFKTPLLIARDAGHESVVALLLSGGAKDSRLTEPVLNAAVSGDFETLRRLVNVEGGPVDGCDESGRTVLHHICLAGELSVAIMIFENLQHDNGGSAAVLTRDKEGALPLHYAAQTGRLDLVEMLVSKGSPIEAGDKTMSNPIYYACRGGSLPVTMWLLKNGASIKMPDKNKRQPFHGALESGDITLIQAMIELGCVEMAEDNGGGVSAWDYARSQGLNGEGISLLETWITKPKEERGGTISDAWYPHVQAAFISDSNLRW